MASAATPTALRRPPDDVRRVELALGALVRAVAAEARLLPALTADGAQAERARLVASVLRGEPPVPEFGAMPRRVPTEVHRAVEEARRLAEHHPAGDLYAERLDELELELTILEVLGDVRRVRPVAARRYGYARGTVELFGAVVCLRQIAERELAGPRGETEPATVAPLRGSDEAASSMQGYVEALAERAGLEVSVRLDPRLVANAATGERTVFLADRMFGDVEARRIAVHEVLGHLVAAANARAQPMRLLEVGTAESFVDQEGVALWLEAESGLMGRARRRTIAARYLAAAWMHDGAAFADVATRLVREHGFAAEPAVAIAERTFRGGGVARDTAYLLGWLRVTLAMARGHAALDEMRLGRVSVRALPRLRELAAEGLVAQAPFRPSLAYSLPATWGGTSPSTLPPSVATSLTMLELT